MKKIRILHIAEAAGGVERYLKVLFKYCDTDLIENILICSQNYDINLFKDINCKVIIVPMAHQANFLEDFYSIRKIRQLIKQYRPDIVYAHSTKAGALGRIANLGIKNKVIYNPHGWAFNNQSLSSFKYKWVERLESPLCDKIVCISEAEKISAIKNKICPSRKLKVIYNGIDLKDISNSREISRAELGIPKAAFVIGCVGRLTAQKAPDVFVKSAVLIKKEIPNAFFLWVGNGELKDQIVSLIEKEKLQKSFLITGWVDDPISYMKLMDVGTLLSRWEGFGLVLPEYMASQVPIVATNTDAIPWIIKDEKNGILVPVDDELSVTKAIEKLHNDQELCHVFVKNGLIDVKTKFNGVRLASESQKLFQEVYDV